MRLARNIRMLVAAIVFVGALAGAALAAGSALADITVGQTGPPVGDTFGGGYEAVQNHAAMPVTGVITSFHTQSSSSCGTVTGTYDFQVLRPLGGNQYRVLGHTGNQTDPCDGQLHSYPVNIPVQAADVLGAYVAHNWKGVLSDTSGSISYSAIPKPAVGDTVTLPHQLPWTGDESATLGCQDPAGAFNQGFNTGFNPGFNSGWTSELRQAYGPHGAWQVGWERGFAAGQGVHAARESAAARPAAVSAAPCDAAFNSGFNQGFNPGFNSGFAAAYKFAFNQGYGAGFAMGRSS